MKKQLTLLKANVIKLKNVTYYTVAHDIKITTLKIDGFK